MNVSLTVDAEKVAKFYPLLQQGFLMKTEVGCSIKTFLCKDLGLAADYVDERIKTLFLDGKAVDDLDSAMIEDGSTLALSAAMPGLVGATLRRGGYLAPLRNEITHKGEEGVPSHSPGTVYIKLFNAILNDLGHAVLKRGIRVKGNDLGNLLKGLTGEFWEDCKSVSINDQRVDPADLLGVKWRENDDKAVIRIESDV